MIAIILAAGMGRRLKNHTSNHTKCMVKVGNKRLIEHMLDELILLKFENIIIVAGYKAENLISHVKTHYENEKIKFIINSCYETTNNIYSLSLVKDYLENNDVLLLESDIILEKGVLSKLLRDPFPNLSVVAKYESWMSGTMVELDDKNNIKRIIKRDFVDNNNIFESYKTVNVHKFSKEFLKNRYLPFLKAYIEAFGKNQFYEEVLNIISIIDRDVLRCHVLKEEKWYEIDDGQDLDVANILFSEENLLQNYSKEYGGYWRFPKLLDFYYLVNPYFPTRAFKREFNVISEELLVSYPSGRRINDKLAASLFSIDREYICIANGASEIIREIPSLFTEGNIGIIFPTFEEYPNTFPSERIISFSYPLDSSLSYKDIIDYFDGKQLSVLLLINPDIPTGRLIEKSEICEIIKWAEKNNIFVIIDESFIDFSDYYPQNTLLKNRYLNEFQNLIIIKSISKSFGVPGIRLGILASGNRKIIEIVRKKLPIWNINSYAQYFMQIIGRFESDYTTACQLLRIERSRVFNELRSIEFLRVLPSQGNFFLCEVLPPFSSTGLAEQLLEEFNILIKDCGKKQGIWHLNFIRIGLKSPNFNDKLITALREILVKYKNAQKGSLIFIKIPDLLR